MNKSVNLCSPEQQTHLASTGHRPDQPVCIHTLGRFCVRVQGQSLAKLEVRQKKPLELLQAIIAFGGRSISIEILANTLWADAEGDAAFNAFDVTLYRLRKLIGVSDVFVVDGGRISLNSELVWVDVWAFERLLNETGRLLILSQGKAVSERTTRLLEQALTFYQGGFLSCEPVRSWDLSLRERLRSNLLRHILDIGRVAENNRHWLSAIRFYQKGLEIEPLSEELYQRLMVCFQNTGQQAEALAVYQRCRKTLFTILHINPSAETESIRVSIAL